MWITTLLFVLFTIGCSSKSAEIILPKTDSFDKNTGVIVQTKSMHTERSIVEVQKEVSRQVCFNAQRTPIPENATVTDITILRAFDAMESALNPDKCKGSTNDSDVAIAKSNNMHGTIRSVSGNIVTLGLGSIAGSVLKKGFDSAGNTIKGSDRSNLGNGDFNESVPTTTTTTITNPVPEDVILP